MCAVNTTERIDLSAAKIPAKWHGETGSIRCHLLLFNKLCEANTELWMSDAFELNTWAYRKIDVVFVYVCVYGMKRCGCIVEKWHLNDDQERFRSPHDRLLKAQRERA